MNCKLPIRPNLDNFDQYRFKNDSFIENVYISYISRNKIKFFIQIIGLKNKCVYEIADTASIKGNIGDDPGVEDDELNSTVFPIYSFLYLKNNHHLFIGIEPSRGLRLRLYPLENAENQTLCSCKIRSLGTLRRIKKANAIQLAPELPKPPTR